jgi:hypothetical protein
MPSTGTIGEFAISGGPLATTQTKWSVSDETFIVTDRMEWNLPNDDEHILETNDPQDLMIEVENVDIIPENTQSGVDDWTCEDEPTDRDQWMIEEVEDVDC